MKMRLALLTLVSLSLPAFSFATADFTGRWISTTGTMTINYGLNIPCEKVNFAIEQTANKFAIKDFDAYCFTVGAAGAPAVLDISNGKLFQKGLEVGSISEDTIIMTVNPDLNPYALKLTMKKAADGHNYIESYFQTNNGFGYVWVKSNHENMLHKP